MPAARIAATSTRALAVVRRATEAAPEALVMGRLRLPGSSRDNLFQRFCYVGPAESNGPVRQHDVRQLVAPGKTHGSARAKR